jgi:hypothetical protein
MVTLKRVIDNEYYADIEIYVEKNEATVFMHLKKKRFVYPPGNSVPVPSDIVIYTITFKVKLRWLDRLRKKTIVEKTWPHVNKAYHKILAYYRQIEEDDQSEKDIYDRWKQVRI